jgi:hypothetical protein
MTSRDAPALAKRIWAPEPEGVERPAARRPEGEQQAGDPQRRVARSPSDDPDEHDDPDGGEPHHLRIDRAAPSLPRRRWSLAVACEQSGLAHVIPR